MKITAFSWSIICTMLVASLSVLALKIGKSRASMQGQQAVTWWNTTKHCSADLRGTRLLL
jgi:hypothetical protein